MAISYKMLYRHVRNVLGNEVAPELIPQQIVDLSQEWLVGMRAWRFLQEREAYISPRARITLTDASWDPTGPPALQLSKTGAFADYTYLDGDLCEITAGTGVTLGRVPIATREDDDTITLSSTIKASTATDVAATIDLPRADLPADFRSQISLHATQSNIDHVDWISPAHMNHLRSLPIVTEGAIRWKAAIEYVETPPRAVLGIFPTPTQNELEAFRLVYAAGVTRASTADPDSTIINWPPWAEPILIETVRGYALGLEPTSNQNLSDILRDIRGGPLWASAVTRDNDAQTHWGQLRKGAASRVRGGRNALFTEPGGPS